MIPFILLLITFAVSLVVIRIMRRRYDPALAGRMAMSVMLLFTAIGHFAFTEGMSMMIPGFIPFKTQLVYVTGVIELLAAIGFLIPRRATMTGWASVNFLCPGTSGKCLCGHKPYQLSNGNIHRGRISLSLVQSTPSDPIYCLDLSKCDKS